MIKKPKATRSHTQPGDKTVVDKTISDKTQTAEAPRQVLRSTEPSVFANGDKTVVDNPFADETKADPQQHTGTSEPKVVVDPVLGATTQDAQPRFTNTAPLPLRQVTSPSARTEIDPTVIDPPRSDFGAVQAPSSAVSAPTPSVLVLPSLPGDLIDKLDGLTRQRPASDFLLWAVVLLSSATLAAALFALLR